MPPKHIAILGGGLTGLSSAFHLSRRFPHAQVTLLEKQDTLGGWVQSERVDLRVRGKNGEERTASVLLEAGPRTLRPNGLAVLELIANTQPPYPIPSSSAVMGHVAVAQGQDMLLHPLQCPKKPDNINLLNLNSSLLTVPRTAPAARNRFLHLPGTRGLLRIPSSLPTLLTSPLARTLVPAVLKDAFAGSNSPGHLAREELRDEAVDVFLTRRFGADFARTFGSALVHGIYAADSRQLSVRAAFPILVEMEEVGRGSIMRGAMFSAFGRKRNNGPEEVYDLGDLKARMEGVSVYSLGRGLSELVEVLERDLARKENVTVVKGDGAVLVRRSEEGDEFEVRTTSGTTFTSSHVVSALPLPALQAISQDSPDNSLPHLTANPTSTVTVVNLVFAGPPESLHPPGFGYLVPRPSGGYAAATSENELGILGTVFDSCALAEQDAGAPVTKMTVMLGGPYATCRSSDVNTPAFLETLLKELAQHLGRDRGMPEPLLVRVRKHDNCIPTPTPGHETRMDYLRKMVRERWGEAVSVIGAGVGGVSVPACVEAGRGVGRGW